MKQAAILQKRILIADDDNGVRQTLKLLLSVDKHTVIEAQDAAEALDLLGRDQFDLVITDFEMPGMKGNELALRIKRHFPSQPILMITAYTEKVRHLENPVDAILDKPFQFEDLRKAIAEIVS